MLLVSLLVREPLKQIECFGTKFFKGGGGGGIYPPSMKILNFSHTFVFLIRSHEVGKIIPFPVWIIPFVL